MATAPIEINFYGEDCEIIETHRTFLRFGVLEEAAQLAATIEEKSDEEAFPEIAKFIVKLFGGKFGVEDLREHAELTEVLSILPSITARATQFAGPENFQKGRGK
jgi:HD superfamily phosphodiesterase